MTILNTEPGHHPNFHDHHSNIKITLKLPKTTVLFQPMVPGNTGSFPADYLKKKHLKGLLKFPITKMNQQSKNCIKSNDLDVVKIIKETWNAVTDRNLQQSGRNLSCEKRIYHCA
jgi:hypothetical protein